MQRSLQGLVVKETEKQKFLIRSTTGDRMWDANRKQSFFQKPNCQSFFFLPSIHYLTIYYATGTVLGAEDTRLAVTKR